jgi:hypothetical protein
MSLFLVFGLFTTQQSLGQIILIDPAAGGGFENGTTPALNGWDATTNTTASRNQWVVNTATKYAGNNSAYITNATATAPPPNTYSVGTARVSHLFQNFTIPTTASSATLSFYWKCTGEGTTTPYDYLRCYFEPATNTAPIYETQKNFTGTAPNGIVNAATAGTAPTTSTYYNISQSGHTGYQLVTITIPAVYFTNTAYRLTFEWTNDDSNKNNPPASIDNVSLTYIAQTPCSGTPAPGNTLASVNSVVSGGTSVLSLQNTTTGSGVTYQWQSSTDNITFTNIGGATASTYTATVTAKTYYRCLVTCSGNTGNSTSVLVSLLYCSSTSSGSTYYISNFVTTGGVSNISNNSAGYSATGYGNFTGQSASNYTGTPTNYTTTWNTTGGVGYGLWIDWNNDLDFADLNEVIYVSSAYNYTTSYSGSITVPGGTAPGNYRMRTKIDYNLYPPLTCGAITGGETEDYTFTVVALAPPTITSISPTSGCVGSSITINGTNLSGATAANVKIGGTQVTSIISNTATQIVAVVGSGTTGAVTVTTANGTATGSPFTVNALPIPTFTVQPGTTACSATDITYTTQSGMSNYAWVVPGVLNTDYSITSGGIGTTNNTVTLKWLTTGSKTVTINYTNTAGCTATAAVSSTSTTVSAPISITVSPSTSPQSTCLGGTGFSPLSVTATGSNPLYQWYSNTTNSTSGAIAVGTNSTTYTPLNTATGINYYYCVVTNAAPCSSANTSGFSGAITVNASPSVAAITGASSVCGGNSITLADSTSGGIWSVTNGTGTASINSLGVLTGTTAGTVTVNYTVTASGCSTPVSFPVTISAATSITTQPGAVSVAVGGNTAFSVVASGSPTSYSWQVSTNGGAPWSTINNGGVYTNATTASLTITGATSSMNGYQYKATANGCGSTESSVGTLTISQFTLVPSSGSNTITCGTNTTLYDHAGPSSDYSNNVDGYTVIENSGTGVISLSGSYNTEFGYDYIYIYLGAGTSGTLLNSYSGRNGTITPFSSAPGQSITVQFFSDGSKQRAGFALNVAYSGACEVCGSLPTTLISSAITATSATISWAAAASPPSGGYQWEVRTSGAAGSGATGLSATGTTAAGVVTANVTGLTQNTTYYFYVRSLCGGTNFSAWTNSSNFITPIATPINNNCNSPTSLSVSPNLTCSTSTSGTTVNATQSFSGCSGTADDDVWYSFVATGSSHIVTVTPSTSNGINDIVFEVFTSSCSSTTSLGCIDATGTSNPETATLTGLTSGSTYYVRVYSRGSNSNNQGAFSICVTSFPACTTPTTQPTVLVFSGITSTAINGSFTAATSAPSNYLVIMNTTGTAPLPVNGTTYSVGSTSLGATNIVISTTNSTTFSSTGLSSNQRYYFYVFSYNATGCSGGPLYLSSPLISNAFTLPSTSYCTPSVSSNNNANSIFFSNISFVGTLNDISNNSTNSIANSTSPRGYQNFTGLPSRAIQAQGQGVNITTQINNINDTSFLKAWVDWNKDGDFTDSGELVYDTGIGVYSTTFGFVIPTSQPIGDYRIRLRTNDYNSNYTAFDPCETLIYKGETEDYLFTVIASCSATITSVTDDATCGAEETTLKATAASGVLGFRWYAALSGGTYLAQTITGNWTTPSISSTTTYYVTSYNSTCESLVRTPVVATYNPIPSVVFSPTSPLLCGENTISLSATGGTEQVYLINENFETVGLGIFSNVNYVDNGVIINGSAAWQIESSTYVPVNPPGKVWFPAISSGFGANKFVTSTSDLGSYIIHTGLISNVLNSTNYLNLTLSFDAYYSHYSADGVDSNYDYFIVEAFDGTNWSPIQTNYADVGIGTHFQHFSINLNAFINIPNLKIRFRYYGEWMDGVAIDNVKLFGSKPMNPSFSWSSTPPVNVYSNALCTIPYTSGTPVATVYIKPTIEQLSSNSFNLTATATLSNGCSVSQNINALVTPKTTPTFAQVAPICVGATLAALPTTSTNGVTGTWSPALNNTVTTTYIFTPNSTNVGCFSSEDMTIEVNPKITPSFTQVAAVCSGASLSPLPTSSSDTIPITGAWSPAINNTATTTYTFTPTAGQCANTAPMTITINPIPSAVNVTPATKTLCAGDSINLIATGGVVGTAGLGYIGTGNSTLSSYPNPLSVVYGGAKHQMLFTTSELNNLGLRANSNITSIGFSIAGYTPSDCVDFTIRIGSTSLTALTTFVSGTTTVYNATFRPSAFFTTTFTLASPYTWDGVSNLIIETVHNSGSNGNGTGTETRYTQTANNTVYYGLKNSVTPAGVASFDALTSWGYSAPSNQRPNIQFGFTPPQQTYTWSPNTTLSPSTGAAVTATPTISTTYTVTSTVNGCTSNASSAITINQPPITTPIYHE